MNHPHAKTGRAYKVEFVSLVIPNIAKIANLIHKYVRNVILDMHSRTMVVVNIAIKKVQKVAWIAKWTKMVTNNV